MLKDSLDQPTVLVIDYGAQYAQLIARRVREAKIYSEVIPYSMAISDILARKPMVRVTAKPLMGPVPN